MAEPFMWNQDANSLAYNGDANGLDQGGLDQAVAVLNAPAAPPPPPMGPPNTPASVPSLGDLGIALPDVSGILGPVPRLPMAGLPAPPPLSTQDPKQQLAALLSLGLALGAGPRGGGAGALEGFAQ